MTEEDNIANCPYLPIRSGDPIGIRHRYAGVLLGRYCGRSAFSDAIVVDCLTLWSWTGGRLEFNAVCDRGVRAEDRCGPRALQIVSLKGVIQIRHLGPGVIETVDAAEEYVP